MGKKEWFGNSCSVWVGVICIIAIIALLFLNLYWYTLCVLLIPAVTITGRWLWLKQLKKKLMKDKEELDYDIKRYEYYQWLSKKELFRWEVKKFLLPAMNILFEIGAIKKLDDKLEELVAYQDWYKWKRLKSYVHWNKHEYKEVVELMSPYVEDDKLEEGEKMRVMINIFGAYRNLEDHEGIGIYIKKLEEHFFDKKKYTVEAADDLMYFYDEHGEKEKIERLKEVIRNLNFKTYSSLLDFYDVVYFQNRRHNDTKANRKLLDVMVEKSRMMEDEERRMIFDVRMLKLYFENDYGWKEYSIKLFNEVDKYLDYNSRVAFEYLLAVNLAVQNSQMYNLHPGIGIMTLYDKVLKRIGEYVEEFDRKLVELPDDFLYRKKEMMMLKVEYLKAKSNFGPEYAGFLPAINSTLRKIIGLCEKAGDLRERLHFLVVLADEITAFDEDIKRFRTIEGLDAEQKKALDALKEEEIETGRLDAKESVQEINQELKKNNYDRTLAYYIFYAAYLNMKLNDMEMAKQMLSRFNATGVDIKHYTLAVQKQYNEVKERLS